MCMCATTLYYYNLSHMNLTQTRLVQALAMCHFCFEGFSVPYVINAHALSYSVQWTFETLKVS